MKIGNVSNIHDVNPTRGSSGGTCTLRYNWELAILCRHGNQRNSEDFGYSMSRENQKKKRRDTSSASSAIFFGICLGWNWNCGDNETTFTTLYSLVSFIFSAFNKPNLVTKAPGTFSGRSVRRERRDWGPLSNAMADPMLCLCTWT